MSPGIEEVRRTRGATLALVERLSQKWLDRRPGADRWSVGEVLDHLLRTDEVYRREIGELVALARAGQPTRLRRGFAEINVGLPFVPRRLLPLAEAPFAVLNLFLPQAARDLLVRTRWLPARHPDVSTPRPGRPAGELRRDLAQSFEAMERLLVDHRDLDWRRLMYYHPVLGWTDVPGVLRFVAGHERRHQDQIREILARVPA